MTTLQAIGIIIGMVAAVAGVARYLHQRSISRPRLVVRSRVSTGGVGYMIVSNRGHVTVVGDHIGYLLSRRDDKGNVLLQDVPGPSIGDRWTNFELAPQHTASLRFRLDDLPKGVKVGALYAQTAVTDRFKVSPYNMWRFRRELARVRP